MNQRDYFPESNGNFRAECRKDAVPLLTLTGNESTGAEDGLNYCPEIAMRTLITPLAPITLNRPMSQDAERRQTGI
jgi:hypothetical protein